jgi:hypothetical protein
MTTELPKHPILKGLSDEVLPVPAARFRSSLIRPAAHFSPDKGSSQLITVTSSSNNSKCSTLLPGTELLSQCQHVLPRDVWERFVEFSSSSPELASESPSGLPFDISSHAETRSPGERLGNDAWCSW